jgi:hypothetical protein
VTATIGTAPPLTEEVTPLKPSEAMRLGRLLYPLETEERLARKVLLLGRPEPAWALCALGAMLVGSGRFTPGQLVDPPPTTRVAYPDLLRFDPDDDRSRCPQCGRICRAPIYVVSHLNDRHLWATERIASWLETRGL